MISNFNSNVAAPGSAETTISTSSAAFSELIKAPLHLSNPLKPAL